MGTSEILQISKSASGSDVKFYQRWYMDFGGWQGDGAEIDKERPVTVAVPQNTTSRNRGGRQTWRAPGRCLLYCLLAIGRTSYSGQGA